MLRFNTLAILSALAATAAVVSPAKAGSIIPGNITGYYYGNQVYATNNTAAYSYINSHAALATFTTHGINYPSFLTSISDSTTLSSFLGADAASLSNSSVGANAIQGQLIRFTGSIYLTSGTTNFVLGSDDGSVLTIGGSQLIDYGGLHSFSSTTAAFTAPTSGWYAFDLLYYENGGDTGVSLGTVINGSSQTLSFTPTASLNTNAVPAPASALGGLVLFGAIATMKCVRRRR